MVNMRTHSKKWEEDTEKSIQENQRREISRVYLRMNERIRV